MNQEQYNKINELLSNPQLNAILLKIQDDNADFTHNDAHNLGYVRGCLDIFSVLNIKFQMRKDGSFYILPINVYEENVENAAKLDK